MSAIAGRVLLIPKGNYDSTATYTMLDMVVYNGSSYICKQECTGVVPTNTTYWMLNASGSAVAYINDIGDVVITNVSNGQVLMYDSTTQKWVNGTISTTLAGLTDTQIASLSNGQVLKYNSTSQKWENADEKGGILPHLIVISETGSTVTATKGQTVITATETSTGHFECDLTEFGTWTIDAVLGGDDAQVSLVVDTVKVYTVDDSHFHGTVTVKYPDGATCRLQSADETLYATGSPYTFTVHHAETYTITVTYNQRIYTDTVTFTTEGQSFSKTLPSPSEVDANDINWWLWFGGVSGTFSTLADILGNSTALSMLMSSTDAVDYLVRCKEWINAGLVPQMTSDTTPSGIASSNDAYSGYGAYQAFCNQKDTMGTANHGWLTQHADSSGRYVQYQFTSKKIVQKVYVAWCLIYNCVIKIQASNDNATWTDLTSSNITLVATGTGATSHQEITFTNSTEYLYYRLYVVSGNAYQGYGIKLQFYPLNQGVPENQSAMSYIGLNNYCANTLLADADWRDGIANSEYIDSVFNVKVPTMTSDTQPSGECSASTAYGASYYAYKAFDNDISTLWSATSATNQWIQYDFVSKKVVMFVYMFIHYSTMAHLTSYTIQGSNDNSTWEDLYTNNNVNNMPYQRVILNNSNKYRYYRVYGTFAGAPSGNNIAVVTLQFYGREDV